MEVNPGVRARPDHAGRAHQPAFSLVRPTFSAARSWFDSLQTSVRMLPTRGINFPASHTLGKATDHVSGLNIGGETRPAQWCRATRRASIRPRPSRRAPRCSERQASLLLIGYELPRLDGQPALMRYIGGGWQLNGIYQARDRFPADR